ncbi:repair protein Rad1/Rec1/Rad17-domain-containing protein [Dichotomocladium elegans]|nr:repair protein Rad1/Rec1/Rad17-domain-containing protein [Dichotomocladium elegans]
MTTALFDAEIISIRSLQQVLRAMSLKNVATWQILDEGLSITIDNNQSIEPFGVSIANLIDCLGALTPTMGESVDSCRIRYVQAGGSLELVRKDNYHEVLCRMVTLEPDAEDTFLSVNRDIVLRAIMRASALDDALSDIDKSCERMTLRFSPQDPRFYIKGENDKGVCEIEYSEASDAFITFQCEQLVKHSYHFGHFMHCKKALEQSDEVSIRISADGMLCMLFRIQNASRESFVEFTVREKNNLRWTKHVSEHIYTPWLDCPEYANGWR